MIKTAQMNGIIVGYDPGGNNMNGLAFLTVKEGKPDDISINTLTNSESVICEILKTENIIGIGVDTLSCWSTGNGGWRPADTWLRENYPEVQNRVMPPNALRGSMVINGMSVLIEAANKLSSIVLSETHPKVLYFRLTERQYDYAIDRDEMDDFLSNKLDLNIKTDNEHEWDAAFSAYALFMGVTGAWKLDLHELPIGKDARIVKPCGKTYGKDARIVKPCGKTYYYWPE